MIKKQIEDDKKLSPSIRTTLDLLLLIVNFLCQRLGLNSRNSSKPPSSDPNREKLPRNNSSNKMCGQKGHNDSTLTLEIDPDITHKLSVGTTLLPEGHYKEVGYETRQVVDIELKRIVTEDQAQIKDLAVPFFPFFCLSKQLQFKSNTGLSVYRHFSLYLF
ncbi:MAG: transposase [Oleiphilaceae bacterium]|jgi:transposase